MKLRDLLEYDDIVIQCHDNPDADAIASGFAVHRYLTAHGKTPKLVYSGIGYIRKSNLVMMIKDLHIPIEHVDRQDDGPEILVTVDCQYGGGNVTELPARNIAVIDHHKISTELPELSEVRENLGACSTLMWQLLKEEGYDVDGDTELVTALRYGLYTDTNTFTEIYHPLDKDLRDETHFDRALMTKYQNANLSLEELEVAGAALLHSDYIDAYRTALVKAGPCDQNILGIISDLVLQVDAIDFCIVFNIRQDGVKYSVRSCTNEIRANELAEELSRGIGNGGGHDQKAGGFIPMNLLIEEYLRFCEQQNYAPRMELSAIGGQEQPTASGVKAMLEKRMRDYMDNTDIIYADRDHDKIGDVGVKKYRRKPVPWGYVRTGDMFETGTEIRVRDIIEDKNIVTEDGMVLLFGPWGEVHTCSEWTFSQDYRIYPDWNFSMQSADYEPTIQDKKTENTYFPMEYAKVCVPKGISPVHAKQLTRQVKLFPRGKTNDYHLGRAGDYLVTYSGDMRDAYVMEREKFEHTYASEEDMAAGAQTKAVVFDLDGTLLDTLEDLCDAVNYALLACGQPTVTLDQVRQYVGNGIKNLVRLAIPDGEDNPSFDEVFVKFREHYGAHCLDNTVPYKDIVPLVRELSAQGIKMAIVSNKVDSAVKELSKRFFPDEIEVAVGEREGVRRKPAPDTVNQALIELGVGAAQAVYVGDSDTDLMTAKNAGLPCVSVTWGFRDEKFLREHGAENLINHPLELLYKL